MEPENGEARDQVTAEGFRAKDGRLICVGKHRSPKWSVNAGVSIETPDMLSFVGGWNRLVGAGCGNRCGFSGDEDLAFAGMAATVGLRSF